GDRLRQVNWRASLRLGTLYVTQHHRERNADVVLMVDTLAEVGNTGWSECPHLHFMVYPKDHTYQTRKIRFQSRP
ncbi:MAG: DUF58 domain-containing protein, partial [bacterium]|nr:DUF58 domain-containing protein [bacterium]